MSRSVIVKDEIGIPEGVNVEVDGLKVRIRGPMGEVFRDFSHAKRVRLMVEGDKITVFTYFASRRTKALVYTIGSHVRNMIDGVTKGFRYKLKIVFAHFPMSVKVVNDRVLIENFMGEKAPRIAKIVGNVKVCVKGDDVIVEGPDIEEVAQTAANIERSTRIKDLDRRVFVDGIYIYERGYAVGGTQC